MTVDWRQFLVILLSLFVATTVSYAQELKLATTTSKENSGQMAYLLPQFTQDTGIEVTYLAVGTGKALRYSRSGLLDVLLVHTPEAEQIFMSAKYGQ